jgi:hypothetical protein
MMALPSHIAAWLSQTPSRPTNFAPRSPPKRGVFFCILPRAALFVLKRGIKARVAELTSRVPHQRGPQTEEGTTRWYGRRPKFVRSAWAWK